MKLVDLFERELFLMTKILIVSIFYAPEQIGISKYTSEMAEYLVESGFDVRVVTAFPFYPEWKRYPGYRVWWWQTETINGVKIIRCPLYVPERVSLRSRLLHLFTFGITSNLAILSQFGWKPDHTFQLMPTIVSLLGTRLISRLCRSKSWLHVQDFELDLAFKIVLGRARANKLVKKMEKIIYRPFDIVSSISQTMLERLVEDKGVQSSQLYFFPNWIDTTAIYPLAYKSPYREEWGIGPDQTIVLYSGNFGQKYDFDSVLQTAASLRDDPSIQFILCGDGAVRPKIEATAANLPNVKVIPLQPMERLNELLNAADIHILPQRPGAIGNVMPSKLLNIFASGRPVIATVLSQSQVGHIVQQVGKVTPPADVPALIEAIQKLAADPALRHQLGMAAIEYVSQVFQKDAVLGNFVKKLKEK